MKLSLKDMTLCGLLAALIAICSWISIPAAVPFTLQTFAVFAAVLLLGGKRGSLAVAVYLLLGAVGLPVFSGFKGGVSALLGPTGGYILGFLISALLIWAVTARFGEKLGVLIAALLLGLAVCYAFGTAWFVVVYSRAKGPISVGAALGMCVVPFILPDLLKIALALLLSNRLKTSRSVRELLA